MRVQEGGGEGEGQRESQADSSLGIELVNEIMTGVRRLTD